MTRLAVALAVVPLLAVGALTDALQAAPLDIQPPGIAREAASAERKRGPLSRLFRRAPDPQPVVMMPSEPAGPPAVVVRRPPPLPRLRPRPIHQPPAMAARSVRTIATAAVPAQELLPGVSPGVSLEITGAIPNEDEPSQPVPEVVPAAPDQPAATTSDVPPVRPPTPPDAIPAEAVPVETKVAALPDPDMLHEDGLPGDPVKAGPVIPAAIPASMAHDPQSLIDLVAPGVAEPYQLVRALQLLQDQIAHGSVRALEAERGLRQRIETAFREADPGVWQVPRNASAAIVYVLSGGAPAILHDLLDLSLAPSVDRRLLEGVLHYVEGREDEARPLFAGIDATTLPPNMGAQVALAQSALAVRTNPRAAQRHLSYARLLAPGSLVEEAALRREIFVANQLNDRAAVERLARRYLTTFRHSIYAGNFRMRFSAAITRMGLVDDEDGFGRIDAMIRHLEPEAKAPLYLTVARSALLQGFARSGGRAAERALALTAGTSADHARALLYRAAALAVQPEAFDEARQAYAASDPEPLGDGDRSLHQAVGRVIADVGSGTELKPDVETAMADEHEPTELMRRAGTLLEETAGMIAAVDLAGGDDGQD